MRPGTLLIAVPALLLLALVLSHLLVPTYDEQTRATPKRLARFIEASSGDARILNPILNADTASSRIVDLVFDGLLDLDEDLALRGKLAERWDVGEWASVAVDPGDSFPDGTPVTAGRIERRVLAHARSQPALSGLVRSARHEAGSTTERSVELPDAAGPGAATVRIEHPERVVFELARVDQRFFERLGPVLGPEYGRRLTAERLVHVEPRSLRDAVLARTEPPAVFVHQPVITFDLRRGVRFHDGHEFDAHDVAFTWRAIMDPKNLSPRTSDFEPIDRVEVLGPHRVRIVYKRLFSPAVNAWTMGILPAHRLDAAALAREAASGRLPSGQDRPFGLRDSAFNRAPVGTGPFRFASWESDEQIHLVRNDGYWDGPARFEHFHFRVIPDPVTREIEFRTGTIDTYAPQPHQVDRFSRDSAYRAFSTLSRGYTYIGYNIRREPFSDPRVRRALGMAIDTGEIIDYVLYGQGEPTTGPYPKNTPWYDHDAPPLPYDPAAALALLEEAGYRRGAGGWLEKDGERLEFNLITNNGNPLRKAILSIAQHAWARIGVKCNTQLFEWAVFLKDFINPGDFDAVILGWQMGIDPDLHQLWHSSQTGENQLNFVGYRSEEADEIITTLRATYDRAEQIRLAHALHRIIARDQPYTFLYAPRASRVLDRKIVMVESDGSLAPVRASRSGVLFHHFTHWKKLAHAPQW